MDILKQPRGKLAAHCERILHLHFDRGYSLSDIQRDLVDKAGVKVGHRSLKRWIQRREELRASRNAPVVVEPASQARALPSSPKAAAVAALSVTPASAVKASPAMDTIGVARVNRKSVLSDLDLDPTGGTF